ncbi:hypothetical protein Efla_002562 [Eimeria flavescens]
MVRLPPQNGVPGFEPGTSFSPQLTGQVGRGGGQQQEILCLLTSPAFEGTEAGESCSGVPKEALAAAAAAAAAPPLAASELLALGDWLRRRLLQQPLNQLLHRPINLLLLQLPSLLLQRRTPQQQQRLGVRWRSVFSQQQQTKGTLCSSRSPTICAASAAAAATAAADSAGAAATTAAAAAAAASASCGSLGVSLLPLAVQRCLGELSCSSVHSAKRQQQAGHATGRQTSG